MKPLKAILIVVDYAAVLVAFIALFFILSWIFYQVAISLYHLLREAWFSLPVTLLIVVLASFAWCAVRWQDLKKKI